MAVRWQETRVAVGHGIELGVKFGRHDDQDPSQPVIILLHEALGCIAMWKDIPEQLAELTGHDVLVYERQGYGCSTPISLPRDDDYLVHEGEVWLPRLLEVLDIQRCVLLGHSDGGSIALIGAATLPEKVVGVVTAAAHIYIDHLTTAGIIEAVERYQTTDLPARLAKYHGERTDTIFRAWSETWLRERKAPMDYRPWLPRILCEALIIQGRQDQYGVPEQVTDICEGIGPRAEPLFLESCGHVPQFEAREPFLTAVSQFMQRLSG
ncbi:alpha/beta fold hydrolase [Neptunomonas marina]|uniref:Alpha/beta hydrolase n=1 Tax=Neptunomonas marina TaxID=1815562 RepID=A0A437QDZ7_9GAMM|nr:alpha/beta hydrolase [Neptunomonas marina]RVU32613.1 alpha/beta hydrolase [Neptunomonas marina]